MRRGVNGVVPFTMKLVLFEVHLSNLFVCQPFYPSGISGDPVVGLFESAHPLSHLTNGSGFACGTMARWNVRWIRASCVERCKSFYRKRSANGPTRICIVWQRNWSLCLIRLLL